MKKIFLTGGAGFIASNLIKQLESGDTKIKVFDTHPKRNKHFINSKQIEYVDGDIRDLDHLILESENYDHFFHFAASGNVIDSISNPRQNFDINVSGTLNCLEAARLNGCEKFVFASTGGALMGNAPPPVSELSLPSPLSPYGASKLACEGYCKAYSESYGLDTLIFRFANVFGKFSVHKQGVFNKFYNDIKNGQALPIYGNPSRDFIYVDDLVAGILQGTNAEANKGEIFHLSSGTETKIIDFARLMHEAYGSKNNFEVQQKSERLGEVKNNSASHTKARNAFGFKCNHTLKEAIQKTVEWYKDNSL